MGVLKILHHVLKFGVASLTSRPLTPHTISHHLTPHTVSHPTPHTECIRGRHNHCHGPHTPPSSTTPGRQPRAWPHPKPWEGHCRELKEPRIYPQGKLNYRNLLPMSHLPLVLTTWATCCTIVVSSPPPILVLGTCIIANVPIDSVIGAGTVESHLSELHLSKPPK